MDIDRVRYFQVFSQTGSLVKASRILNISQPALSKALRLLQDEVGLQLVEPDGRGLRLTESGLKFRDESAPLLAQWLDLGKRLRDQETATTPLRLGSFEVFTTYFLSSLVDGVGLENLEIHEYGPGRLEKALADGRIDLGITYAPVPTSGIDFTEVTKVTMGVFGRSESFHSLAFDELPFVIPLLPAEGTPSKVAGLDGWPDHRHERRIKYKVTMMESALELCRSGHAVAYLPEFVVRLHNRYLQPKFHLQAIKTPIPQKDRQQSVYLLQNTHQKGAAHEAVFRRIAKCLRKLD